MSRNSKVTIDEIVEATKGLEDQAMDLADLGRRMDRGILPEAPPEAVVLDLVRMASACADLAQRLMHTRAIYNRNADLEARLAAKMAAPST